MVCRLRIKAPRQPEAMKTTRSPLVIVWLFHLRSAGARTRWHKRKFPLVNGLLHKLMRPKRKQKATRTANQCPSKTAKTEFFIPGPPRTPCIDNPLWNFLFVYFERGEPVEFLALMIVHGERASAIARALASAYDAVYGSALRRFGQIEPSKSMARLWSRAGDRVRIVLFTRYEDQSWYSEPGPVSRILV
jgi:hypothetical protein